MKKGRAIIIGVLIIFTLIVINATIGSTRSIIPHNKVTNTDDGGLIYPPPKFSPTPYSDTL